MSLISRKLLTPDEELSIENPYALVMIAGKPPVMATIPDISKMHFNKLNKMGTKEENQALRIKREEEREQRPFKPVKVWNIWNKEIKEESKEKAKEETKEKTSNAELIQDKFRKNIKEINEKDI